MIMETKNELWTFGLRWFFASAIGLTIGGALAVGAFWTIGGLVERTMGATLGYAIGGAILGASFALGISLGQDMLLQDRGLRPGSWVAASVIAATLSMALVMPLAIPFTGGGDTSDLSIGIILGLALGVPMGIGQSLVLSRHALPVGAWPLVSTVAFLLAMTAGLSLSGEGREWLSLGITGLLAGAVTAAGIVSLLRRQNAPASI